MIFPDLLAACFLFSLSIFSFYKHFKIINKGKLLNVKR
jgi:hypothetical protein